MRDHFCSGTAVLRPLWTPEQPGYIAEHVQRNDGSHLTPSLDITGYFLRNQNMEVVLQEQPTAGHSVGLSTGQSVCEPDEWSFLAPCPKGAKYPLCHPLSFIVWTLVQYLWSA